MALSISSKLILATSAIIVVTVGSTIGVMSFLTGEETRSRVTGSIELAASAAANEIKGDISEASSAGRTMADLIGERHARGFAERKDVIASLKMNLENVPQTTGSWYLGSPDNTFDGHSDIVNDVSRGANSKGNFTPTWSRRQDGGFDFIAYELNYTESFYKTAADSRQMFITEPYRDAGSKDPQLEFSVTFPVISGNKLIGVSGVDIGLGSTSQRLAAMKPLGSGSVSLLSADGLWIAGKDVDLLTKPYGNGTGSAELAACLADGKPNIVYDVTGDDGVSFSRTFFPFTIPGTAKRWAVVMDIPSSVVAAPVNRQLGILLVGGIAILGLTVLGLWLATARIVKQPLALLGQRMKDLASGRLDVAIDGQDRGDEIGAMAKTVQVFKDAANENKRLEAEAASAREAQAASRDRQSAIDDAKAEDLKVFAHSVEAGFDHLSQGDLTVRMTAAVAPEFEPIRAKFNDAVAQLEGTIGSVVGAVGTMRVGLSQITVAAGDLSQRTEQQAASLEETVAALGEVVRGVNQTAQGAEDARAAAALAQMEAEKGGGVVAQAVTAMAGIEQSSEKIGRIIGVIDEIAFHTTLLALNAGVEAARAGEAGRGFAVVAQEVRGLAQRSAEAAKEIKDLISTSSAQVAEGVEFVSASGRSLEQIVAQVGGVATMIAQMAQNAREQSVALKEVSVAADQMDKVTQQNAAMVEETTAAAQSLSGETEQLAGLVDAFRTASALKATAARQAARAASRSAASPARPVVQMRTVGLGGAAPKATPANESWEEF